MPANFRESKVTRDGVFYRCKCDEHQGKWLHESYFTIGNHKRGNKVYRIPSSICKVARCRKYTPFKKPIAVLTMRPYVKEIIERCGSIHGAARTIGISVSMLHRWTDDYNYGATRMMHNVTAAKIIATLHGLQTGVIEPAPSRPFKASGAVLARRRAKMAMHASRSRPFNDLTDA